MTALSILSLILAIPNIVLVGLSQLSVWQRKEYRLDRVLSTLRDNELTWRRLYFVIPLTFFVVGYIFKLPTLGVFFHLTILFFYLPRTIKLGLFRPKWTQKSTLLSVLFLISICFYLTWFVIAPTNLAIRSSALVLIIFPLVAFLTYVVNKITNPKKVAVIEKAKALRGPLKDLQVIGITGSYGKTTTKHFLSTLMPEASVLKEHRNSDYIIAVDMLEQLAETTKQYIVEMSAYKRGEIADICEITSPSIGVITHIGNQHLALFGSQENILKAKWELIEALPSDGIAVLNADDERIVEKAKSFKGSIKWFSQHKRADVYAENVRVLPTKIEFALHISNNSYELAVELLSEAYLSSILAATCVAHAAGVTDTEIVDRIKSIRPLLRTMQLVSGVNEASIIDDSYSSSEHSVENAITHLKRFPSLDKRTVLVPLIELGSESKAVHERIGKMLDSLEGKIYVYGKAYSRQLNQEVFTDPEKLLQAVSAGLSADSVILLEGRVPDIIRKKLIVK